MSVNVLEKLLEHNNWANQIIIQACSALTSEQLDAPPSSATSGTIRETLMHLVKAQHGYLSLLTLPAAERRRISPLFSELAAAAALSGDGLLQLARDPSEAFLDQRLQTTDGFFVEPWVVMLQVVNHATEHREQIKSMLTVLGLPSPEVDGWAYAEATRAMVPINQP